MRARNRDRVKKPRFTLYTLGWFTRRSACRGCSPDSSQSSASATLLSPLSLSQSQSYSLLLPRSPAISLSLPATRRLAFPRARSRDTALSFSLPHGLALRLAHITTTTTTTGKTWSERSARAAKSSTRGNSDGGDRDDGLTSRTYLVLLRSVQHFVGGIGNTRTIRTMHVS